MKGLDDGYHSTLIDLGDMDTERTVGTERMTAAERTKGKCFSHTVFRPIGPRDALCGLLGITEAGHLLPMTEQWEV